jgi:hypothetical protein
MKAIVILALLFSGSEAVKIDSMAFMKAKSE